MYGLPMMSKDLNLPFPSSPFKQGKDEPDHQQQKQHEMNLSGLLRYRSVPNTLMGDVCDETAAAESMFARFMSPNPREHMSGGGSGEKQSQQQTTTAEVVAATAGFHSSGSPHMFFHSSLQQQSKRHMTSAASGVVETSCGAGSGGSSSCSSGNHLVRYGSSPAAAGNVSHMNVENGFSGIRSISGFSSHAGASAGAGSNSEARTNSSRLMGQLSFSPRQGSTNLMSQISETGNSSLARSSPDEGGGGGDGVRSYIPAGYPGAAALWEDSVILSDGFSGGKRVRDPSESVNGPSLTHHYSLPKTTTEMAAMERILQFQDVVPCKIRAKRGCATHPRSIAERVRRTRISERMRKLQELVPNMDKQTNTADMLDLAVDYIKDLQMQTKKVGREAGKYDTGVGDGSNVVQVNGRIKGLYLNE